MLTTILLLAALGVPQDKPKIDYSKFGSVARQMIVYENVQRQEHALERERIRKLREDQLRLMPQRIVVNSRYTAFYGRGYAVACGNRVSVPILAYNSRSVANRCLGLR